MLEPPQFPSSLPESFMFGVATADHQCEAYDANYQDIHDLWEHRRNLTRRGKATDFWNRYSEDIQLAKALGCKLFRFSLTSNREWGLKFSPSSDFGLYHIELDTDPALKRVPTPAALTYQKLIEKRGAP